MYRYLLPTIVGMNYTDITVTSLDGNKRIPKWRNFLAISPHHSVGFLFSDLYLPALPGPPPPPPRPPFTHNLCHTSSTHTHTPTTPLLHTPSHILVIVTHISFTHPLPNTIFVTPSHTSLPHTILTPVCRRRSCVLRGGRGP